MHNDLVAAADANHTSALVLLDLSCTVDAVDHRILLSVLKRRFDIEGMALRWFDSNQAALDQPFAWPVSCTVIERRCFQAIAVYHHMENVIKIFDCYCLSPHSVADDKQAYISAILGVVNDIIDRCRGCPIELEIIEEIASKF